MARPKDLYSAKAKALLGNSFPFPEPQIPVRYNFDQGVPAPELYPIVDLEDYLKRALETDGVLSCSYYGDAGYEEMTYGFAGLRETLARRLSERHHHPLT